jgi:hypothetical protein
MANPYYREHATCMLCGSEPVVKMREGMGWAAWCPTDHFQQDGINICGLPMDTPELALLAWDVSMSKAIIEELLAITAGDVEHACKAGGEEEHFKACEARRRANDFLDLNN